jgi:hypothetical protein
LDSWTNEEAWIMESVGNKIANAFYEHSMTLAGNRINSMSTDNQRKQFINQKYSKKNYIPQERIDPVKMLYECRQKGVAFNPNYFLPSASGSSQNIPVQPQRALNSNIQAQNRPLPKPVLKTLSSFNVFDNESGPNSVGKTIEKKGSVDIFETTPGRKNSFNLMSDTPPRQVKQLQGFNNGFMQANMNQNQNQPQAQKQNSNLLMGQTASNNGLGNGCNNNTNMGMMGQNTNMGMMTNNTAPSMGMNNGIGMGQQSQFGMMGNQNLGLQRNISSNSNASYGGQQSFNSNNSGSTYASYGNGNGNINMNVSIGSNTMMGANPQMSNGYPQNNSGLNMGMNQQQQQGNKYAALDRLTMNPQHLYNQQQQIFSQQQKQMNNGMGGSMGGLNGGQGFNNNGNVSSNSNSQPVSNGMGIGMTNKIAWN